MSHPELPWQLPQIKAVLPHREPFLLVDRVTGLEPDRCIDGEKSWGPAEARNRAPGGDMVPAPLVIEALAQLGAILILMKPENRGRLIYFMGIEKVRYRLPIRVGDSLLMHADVVRLRRRVGTLRGHASVDGRRVADGTMHFALGELA